MKNVSQHRAARLIAKAISSKYGFRTNIWGEKAGSEPDLVLLWGRVHILPRQPAHFSIEMLHC